MFASRFITQLVITAWFVGLTSATATFAASPKDAPAFSPPAGTPVRIHVKNVTARQALDDLGKQTGLAFESDDHAADDRMGEALVSIDLDDQPLWLALVAVCDAAELRPLRFTAEKPGIVFGNRDGGWSTKFTVIHGGFAVGLVRIEQNLRRQYESRNDNLSLVSSLMICVCPEPGLHAKRIASMQITRCVDENGTPITDIGAAISPLPTLPALPVFQIRTGNSTRLSRVEGQFTAVIEKENNRPAEVTIPFIFGNVPLPNSQRSPAALTIATVPATLPALARTVVDVDKEVRGLLPQLSAITAEERQDAELRLGLLPPAAFSTVEAIARDPNIPPAARQQLSLYLTQRRPLQDARLRHIKAVEAEKGWEESNALDAFARFGKRDRNWDGLVRDAFHRYYQSQPGAMMEARALFEKAMEAGCDDAFVLSCAASAMEQAGGNPRQILKIYEQAYFDLRNGKYPDYFKIANVTRYYLLLHKTSVAETGARKQLVLDRTDRMRMAELKRDSLLFWPGACHQGATPAKLLSLALRILYMHSGTGVDLIEPVYRQLAPALEDALPNRSEPLVLKGAFQTIFAWEARGSGTADTVTAQGFKLMNERLAVAEAALKKAYEIDPTDSAAPTEMIGVELGQGKGLEVMEQWYRRALEADPDNLAAGQRKMYYLEPKWYGSAELMLGFGEECLRSGNYAARFPMMLMDAHKRLAAYAPDYETYYSQPRVWQDVQRVYEPYLRVRPNDADARSAYCYYSGVCGHWSIAREQLDFLGNNIVPSYFGSGSLDDVKEFRAKAQAASKASGGL